MTMIEPGELQDLLARWWWNYDEGRFDVLAGCLTDDAHFTCRTDTGTTDWEEFVRADVRGRDAFLDWQAQHRLDSPYPLRHHGTNVHVVERDGDEATFTSYLHVTQIVGGGPAALPGGVVNGRVRRTEGGVRISAMEVVLDTMESAVFSETRTLVR
jgi:SnoaL-like domain